MWRGFRPGGGVAGPPPPPPPPRGRPPGRGRPPRPPRGPGGPPDPAAPPRRAPARPQRLLEPRQPRVALQPEADLAAEEPAQGTPVHREPGGDDGDAGTLAQLVLYFTDQRGAGAGTASPGREHPLEVVEQQRRPARA